MNKRYGICSAGRDGLFYVVCTAESPQTIVSNALPKPEAQAVADRLNTKPELITMWAGCPQQSEGGE